MDSQVARLLELLAEQAAYDRERQESSGYATNSLRSVLPDRPSPLSRLMMQPSADLGLGIQGGVQRFGQRGLDVTGGGGNLSFAFPLGEGVIGLQGQGSAARINPAEGRGSTQFIPQGAQAFYETPEGSRYSLEYNQTPRFNDLNNYARELILRYSTQF